MAKRPLEGGELVLPDAKRQQGDLVVAGEERPNALSDLQSAEMHLTGHDGAVLGTKFSPDGRNLATCSFDKRIKIWDAWGSCKEVFELRGHSNAVLEIHWSFDGNRLFSCGADKTIQIWDLDKGERARKITKAHGMIINSIAPQRRGEEILASGGDDGFLKLWDTRGPKRPVFTANTDEKLPITAITFNDGGDMIFAGNTSGVIQAFETRKKEVSYQMVGHRDVVSGLEVSPDGNSLLSNSLDSSMRQWDIKPFVANVAGPQDNRELYVMTGHSAGDDKNLLRCAWSPDKEHVTGGNGATPSNALIWSTDSKELAWRAKGHSGSINEVRFHPTQPILATASSDRTVILRELEVLDDGLKRAKITTET